MKRLVFILTAICAAISVMAQNVDNGGSEKVTFLTDGVGSDSIPMNVYQVMTEPPQFYGGIGAMDKFIIDNLRYPAEAWNDTIYSKKDVFGSNCIIRKDGRAIFPRPTDMHPALSQEIARVVSLMPSWKPATKDGNIVDVVFAISTSVLDPFFHIPYSGMPYVKKAIEASNSLKENYKFGISKAQTDSVSTLIYSVHEKGWDEMTSTLAGARLLAMLGRYDDAVAMLDRALVKYHDIGFTKDGHLGNLYPDLSCYNPKVELYSVMTLAAIYDMSGQKDKARETYDNAIWLAGTMAEQGIRDNGTESQRSRHYYDLMREKAAIVSKERGASVRLNPSERREIDYEPRLGDTNWRIEQRMAEGKISNARLSQINGQMDMMNFDQSNRKSVSDAFRLYKICAMLTGLRDGTEAEHAFFSEVSGGEAGKKMAKYFTKWSKDLSLPVASHKEMLENIVFYAPLNVSGTENETDEAAAKAFYDKRKQIEEVYPLGWLCK